MRCLIRFASLKRYFFYVAICATPLLAAEEGGAEEGPAMIWKVLNFLMLAGGLGYLLVKNLGPALASNRKAIADGLAAGEKAKKEAEARAATVQAKLANLGQEIAAMQANARVERDREAERIRNEAQSEMARIRTQSQNEIESAGKQARLELRRHAAKLALELAEQKVRARMSPDVEAGLLAGFLSSLDDTARTTRAS